MAVGNKPVRLVPMFATCRVTVLNTVAPDTVDTEATGRAIARMDKVLMAHQIMAQVHPMAPPLMGQARLARTPVDPISDRPLVQ